MSTDPDERAPSPTHHDRAETILDALRKWWGLPPRHPADDDHSELRLIRTHLDAVRAEGEAERDTLRRALEESRGQVRTLRLTLDQGVEVEAALCAEIRHLKAELHREREANRPLRHGVEQFVALQTAAQTYLVCKEDLEGHRHYSDIGACWAARDALVALLPKEPPR